MRTTPRDFYDRSHTAPNTYEIRVTGYQGDRYLTEPNEVRADRGRDAVLATIGGEWENDTYTDVVDALAHILHFCNRAVLDIEAVIASARAVYIADLEDGPKAQPLHARYGDFVSDESILIS
jgi:hypothetical protein